MSKRQPKILKRRRRKKLANELHIGVHLRNTKKKTHTNRRHNWTRFDRVIVSGAFQKPLNQTSWPHSVSHYPTSHHTCSEGCRPKNGRRQSPMSKQQSFEAGPKSTKAYSLAILYNLEP